MKTNHELVLEAVRRAEAEGRILSDVGVRVATVATPDPPAAAREYDPAPRTEAAFQADVVRYAEARGWLCYHTFDSRRSEKGFLDLVCLRGAAKVVLELKVGPRRPTPEQLAWQAALVLAGVPALVVYPKDWALLELILGGLP